MSHPPEPADAQMRLFLRYLGHQIGKFGRPTPPAGVIYRLMATLATGPIWLRPRLCDRPASGVTHERVSHNHLGFGCLVSAGQRRTRRIRCAHVS